MNLIFKDTLKADLRAAQGAKVNLELCNKSKMSLSSKTDELKRLLSDEGRQLLEANEKLSHVNYGLERLT